MKIGVLGGTFDPPHVGHLAIAKAAIESFGLDEVLFMPAARNPLKRAKGTPSKHRIEMVKRLIEKEPNMSVSDLEITRGGHSYSVDTMAELQMVQPAEYWFLLGTDAMQGIDKWKQPERLIKLCRLGLVKRGTRVIEDVLIRVPEALKDSVDLVQMPMIETSSSELRDMMERGRSVTLWIPNEVASYIRENKLYSKK